MVSFSFFQNSFLTLENGLPGTPCAIFSGHHHSSSFGSTASMFSPSGLSEDTDLFIKLYTSATSLIFRPQGLQTRSAIIRLRCKFTPIDLQAPAKVKVSLPVLRRFALIGQIKEMECRARLSRRL